MDLPSGNDVISAINFDDIAVDMWIDVNPTGVSEGTTFGDRIGNSLLQTLIVSGGRVNIQLPARSYAVWVENQAPVPVELVSFTGKVEKNNVLLNWKTATEVNNFGFEIERSQTSNVNSQKWDKIGFINGSGNSNSPKEYSYIDKNMAPGNYEYRLKQIDTDGQFDFSSSVFIEIKDNPEELSLFQNYPNPFNPSTKIRWQSTVSSWQTLKVYDVLGNEVAALVNEYKPAGSYEVEFSAKGGLPSGIYYYQLGVNNYIDTKKMLYLK